MFVGILVNGLDILYEENINILVNGIYKVKGEIKLYLMLIIIKTLLYEILSGKIEGVVFIVSLIGRKISIIIKFL